MTADTPRGAVAAWLQQFRSALIAYSGGVDSAVGVDAQIMVVDGLYHGFMINPGFPEAQEGYAIAAAFFDTHLGR